jgi:isocitrate/isopropylmalate dehydrogenase
MMLDHIGEEEAAAHVQKAVKAVLAAGKVKTRDMGGSATTSEIGDAIAAEFLAAK